MNIMGKGPLGQKGAKPVRSKPMRNAAQGETCTLRLDCCNGNPATTVLAHVRMFGVAGMAQKPHDAIAVFACSACHDVLDRRVTDAVWGYDDVLRAMIETLSRQIASGNIICRGDA